MAGAAGFEPAVPGLGGRCIIQAVLRARLPHDAPFKKGDAPKTTAPKAELSRCHQACFVFRSSMEPPRSSLPTPYSDSSKFVDSRQRALPRRVAARDAGRRFWTRLATMRPAPELRLLLSLIAPATALLLLTEWEFASYQAAIAAFSILALLLIPTNMAAVFAGMSARDRLKLRDGGQRSMDAYPGVERILNTLRERVLRERIRLLSALLGTLSIVAVWNLDTGESLGSLLLGASAALGVLCLLNSMRLDESIPMRSNAFPLLSLHAPTLHHSVLDRPLTDLMVAHLDPETAGAWDEWVSSLAESVRIDQTADSAIEHLLRALHLNEQRLLDDARLLTEAKRVFKVAAIDGLTDDSNKFNLKSLKTLLAHTKAWEPGLFRLIDRLQDSAIRVDHTLTEELWRLDLDLPPRCSQGQADLFVLLHNNTGRTTNVKVDVVVAEGEPALQTIRVEAPPSRRLDRSRVVDQVDSLGRLLDDAIVLWIGLAWPDSELGSHPVQVTLRGEDGETLSSIVVQTTLSSKVQPESVGQRMSDAASAVRRLTLSMTD